MIIRLCKYGGRGEEGSGHCDLCGKEYGRGCIPSIMFHMEMEPDEVRPEVAEWWSAYLHALDNPPIVSAGALTSSRREIDAR